MSEGQGHRSIALEADPFVVPVGRRAWISRLIFVATFVLVFAMAAWGAQPAFAASSASSVASLVSSAAIPAMSLRPEEAKRAADARESRAPLCDIRCATTFAPAPQFQDEEVSLAVSDDDDDTLAIDLVRMVPGGSPQVDAPHDDPCTLAPPRVSPAPPEAMLAPIASSTLRGPRGVPSSVERPPRA